MTATSFPTSSDETLKTDVADLTATECWQFCDAVSPKKYTRIDTGLRETGFVAQDVEAATQALPDFAHIVSRDEDNLMNLDYSRMVTVLLGCVRDLSARVLQLESAVGA